jgi:hypothetical protein
MLASDMLTTLLLALQIALATPAPLHLSADEAATLEKGQLVIRHSDGKAAIGIINIAATPANTWREVLNVEPRVQEVGTSTFCEIYQRSDDTLKVTWGLGVLGLSVNFHLVYRIDNAAMFLEYTLDTTRENEIDFAVGSYQVHAHGTTSRLVYRNEANPKPKMPAFVRSFLINRSLRQQLDGIKARAEAH